ncbi:MAG TPA: AMP-binding protein, partial [Acidimicrobiia bacterium]|nr:AMP-binding protein [Acidimicrobiia bacterium]
MQRSIPLLVRAAVDDVAEKTWLYTPAGELTYADMLARVERAASALRAREVGVGDRVLVTARNTADYLLSWFAIMEVGAIQVPVNPKSAAGEIAGFVEQVRPALVV